MVMDFPDKRQLRNVAQDSIDNGAVFFGLDAARGIDDLAGRSEMLACRLHETSLETGQLRKVAGAQSPADFGALAEDPRVRAGDIEKDAIKGLTGKFNS